MKFIADAMLGRLAKWLRLFGLDVLYYPDIEDRNLIKIAREQNRSILTRDTNIIHRKAVPDFIFIESDDVFQQLAQLDAHLCLAAHASSPRCPLCNGELQSVAAKENVREVVPEYVYHSSQEFMKCTQCEKIYWQGSHRRNIRETIGGILSPAADSDSRQGRP